MEGRSSEFPDANTITDTTANTSTNASTDASTDTKARKIFSVSRMADLLLLQGGGIEAS